MHDKYHINWIEKIIKKHKVVLFLYYWCDYRMGKLMKKRMKKRRKIESSQLIEKNEKFFLIYCSMN